MMFAGRSLRTACTAVLALSLFASSKGQAPQAAPNPEPPTATIKVTTKLVVLDVVVTNAKGEIVGGLRKDDFTLLQDGKPQAIRNFEGWEEQPSSPNSATASAPGTGTGPVVIYVLDNLNTPFDEQAYSAYMLKQHLSAQPATLAVPATLLSIDDKGAHTLASYTTSRDALLSALQHRPATYPDQFNKEDSAGLLSESFAVLRQIALSSEGARGHKTLVWIGRGFPTISSIDLDDIGQALDAAMKDTVTLLTRERMTMYKIDPITTNARMADTDVATAIDMGSTLGANSHLAPTDEKPIAGDFNFNQFVVQTGGQYFYGSNDLQREMQESVDRGLHLYTLTYVPPANQDPSSYRTIRIKMRDPQLTAVTRQGFYGDAAPHAEASTQQLGFDLKLAAASSMVYSGVGVRIASVTPVAAADKMSVVFAVEDRTLTWSAQPRDHLAASVLVVLVALDANRKIQFSTASQLGLAAAGQAETQRGVLNTQAQSPVNAKTRYLKLLVQDSSGRIGTAEIDQLPALSAK